MDIGVIGGGSWGTAQAKLLAENGNQVQIWCNEEWLPEIINEKHENTEFLEGYALPDNVEATSNLHATVEDKDMILSVSPSQFVRGVLTRVADDIPFGVPIVSATKGIENETLMLVSDILEDVLPHRCHPYLAYLSGPSFAVEVADRQPTAVTVASYNHHLAEEVQELYSNEYFRCYTSTDVPGVEIGGAVKNVIAIAAGAVKGMGLGHNALTGMITRGLHEISRLAVTLGANPLTLQGLAGMGDLVLTCTSDLSRNQTVGRKLGQGMSLDEILDDMNMVAEGVKTSISVRELTKELDVEMPISEEVYRVLHEGKSARQAVKDLMSRELKPEMRGFY